MTDLSGEEFMTVKEVADKLHVSKMTVYRMVESGDLKAVKVGRSIRLIRRSLWNYLSENVIK